MTRTLTPEQQTVVDTWGTGMAVLAGAGSGKTTTLVEKCVRLIQRKPDARFVAVSFTERSASDLRAKLSQSLTTIQGPQALHSHWIMTIHGLCGALIREYPRHAGFEGEEVILTESESELLWERALEALWMDDLPEEVRIGFETLLDRESRDRLADLLKRVRELASHGVMESIKTSEDPATRALAHVSHYVVTRYERSKRRQGVLDFNDLERGADRALEHPEVREAYHRRFDLVLVDEFQDTNPLQAKILWRLARPDTSNLCVVGDPKQSIYRFRDADVSVFEEFCSRLPVQQLLSWNFRSVSGIIDFANQVCQKAFEASHLRFDALVSQKPQISEEPSVVRLDLENPQQLGQWIQAEVARGIPLERMALLVRKIRGNEKWFKALAACGIPIAIGSGGLFWQDPRVRELVAFLKWWMNPGNSLSGAVFLRAPWVSIPDPVLDTWVKEDPTWRKPFFASDHRLAESLRPFLSRTVRPGELLMALLVSQEIEDELGAPLLGLWHRVEDLSSKGLDFHAVVTELQTAMEENRREREVPAPRHLGQLTVLTIHGSKGLEFPHVLLIDFGLKPRSSEAPLLFWDRNQGAFLGRRDANGERDRNHPLEAKWRDLEVQKNLAESKRLFYVALTRAQERLILVCPSDGVRPSDGVCPSDGKDAPAFKPETAYYQDHWRAWVECSGASLPAAPTFTASPVAPVSAVDPIHLEIPSQVSAVPRPRPRPLVWTRARHSVTEWNLLSRCPRAYEWTFIRPVPILPGIPEAGISTGEKVSTWMEEEITQQELGTRVHACLEKGNYDGLKRLEEEVGPSRFLADPVISWALSSPWMAPAQPNLGREVWTELAFEVPVGREVLVGSMDRVVIEDPGERKPLRCAVIDFKVSERPKSVASMVDAYQTQLSLYAYALSILDPRIQISEVSTFLVNISSRLVQPIPLPISSSASQLSELSQSIIQGESGQPKPGRRCRNCEFRVKCPAGQEAELNLL